MVTILTTFGTLIVYTIIICHACPVALLIAGVEQWPIGGGGAAKLKIGAHVFIIFNF